MVESILNGKAILAVDDEPHVLSTLEEEILTAAPKCKFGEKNSQGYFLGGPRRVGKLLEKRRKIRINPQDFHGILMVLQRGFDLRSQF